VLLLGPGGLQQVSQILFSLFNDKLKNYQPVKIQI
jgi:hypothetical protein